MKQRTLTILPLLIMAAFQSCKGPSAFYFREEGPTPPLLAKRDAPMDFESVRGLSPVTQNSSPNSHEHSPALMSNEMVAYVTEESGNRDILAMDYNDTSGGKQVILVRTRSDEKAPCVKQRVDGNEELFFVTNKSGRQTEIVYGTLPRIESPSHVPGYVTDVNWPDWNRQGDRMLFSALGSGGQYETYLIDHRGTAPRMISYGRGQRARWHPSEDKFVYTSRVNKNWQISTYDISAGKSQTLIADDVDRFDPVYSPDGRSIAFASNKDGSSDIWIMFQDGSEPKRVTINGARDCHPVFTEDGSSILFASDRSGSWDIWKVETPKDHISLVPSLRP